MEQKAKLVISCGVKAVASEVPTHGSNNMDKGLYNGIGFREILQNKIQGNPEEFSQGQVSRHIVRRGAREIGVWVKERKKPMADAIEHTTCSA